MTADELGGMLQSWNVLAFTWRGVGKKKPLMGHLICDQYLTWVPPE